MRGAIDSGLIANLNLKLAETTATFLLYEFSLATIHLILYAAFRVAKRKLPAQNSCGATTLLATKQLANAVGGRTGGSICKLSFLSCAFCVK